MYNSRALDTKYIQPSEWSPAALAAASSEGKEGVPERRVRLHQEPHPVAARSPAPLNPRGPRWEGEGEGRQRGNQGLGRLQCSARSLPSPTSGGGGAACPRNMDPPHPHSVGGTKGELGREKSRDHTLGIRHKQATPSLAVEKVGVRATGS